MDKLQQFWNNFCVESHKKGTEYKDAFQFGASADWLADLVVEGKKTATTSSLVLYELEKEAIPQVDEYYIVLNGQDEPVAVIQIKLVSYISMNEVTEDYDLLEGEVDYQIRWEAHKKYFTEIQKEYSIDNSSEMLVVCERFEKVYPKY